MNRWLIQAITLVLALLPGLSHANLNVFACEPEWKALADKIGGEHVTSFSATTQWQNPHYISAKPSLLAKMRKSDLVFCAGAGLEEGWLPVLLKSAGKADVQPGRLGHLMASDLVTRLEVIEDSSFIDRSMGDIHPEGNPHVHLDPYRVREIAKVLTKRLVMLDRANKSDYNANLDAFERELDKKQVEWNKQKAALASKQFIVYHKNWSYLADWLGLNIVDTIERKPGILPSMRHLTDLVSRYQDEQIDAILLTPFEDDNAANMLAEKLDTKVVILPYTSADDLFKLYDDILTELTL